MPSNIYRMRDDEFRDAGQEKIQVIKLQFVKKNEQCQFGRDDISFTRKRLAQIMMLSLIFVIQL